MRCSATTAIALQFYSVNSQAMHFNALTRKRDAKGRGHGAGFSGLKGTFGVLEAAHQRFPASWYQRAATRLPYPR